MHNRRCVLRAQKTVPITSRSMPCPSTSLFHAIRLASSDVRYPLAVDGSAQWRSGREPIRVRLPDVPADHIIAASFASTEAAAFSFGLETGRRKRAETARFGNRPRRREQGAGCDLAIPVDCFHTRERLPNPVLSLRCAAPAPRAYLFSVAVRPRLVDPPPHPPADVPSVPASSLSQRSLAADDQPRGCSPTATAMALGIADVDDLRAFVELARHRPSGLLGVWPQNLWAAARRGRLGAVELVSDWETVRQVLTFDGNSGGGRAPSCPAVIASIRFRAGGLPGSPLPKTGGHLVAVRGIADGAVLAHDPAAPTASVLRRYDALRFASAWMRHRGAAYVFASASAAHD